VKLLDLSDLGDAEVERSGARLFRPIREWTMIPLRAKFFGFNSNHDGLRRRAYWVVGGRGTFS
jgi:hypothetical protein